MNDRRIDALMKLYKADNSVKGILDWAANRERNSSDTQVESFLKTVNLPRLELIASLRKLEHVGMGKFIAGRRGNPSRFAWAVGLVSAGRCAQGKMHILENLPDLTASSVQVLQKGEQMENLAKSIQITLTKDQLQNILHLVAQ